MSNDDFVLTWEDVLYMQLLLQHFDVQRATNANCANNALQHRNGGAPGPSLLLSVDPATVALFRAALCVGHDRGPGDPPKRPPRPLASRLALEAGGGGGAADGGGGYGFKENPMLPKVRGTSLDCAAPVDL
jgi:hypothetical protein